MATRVQFLRRGALVVGSGTAFAAFAAPGAAASVPDADLAYLRLLVAGELLKTDFETRALASGKLNSSPAVLLRRMRADDTAHYGGLARLLNTAGEPAATSGDIDFAYPRGSFASQSAIVEVAWKLGTLTLGAYLGAVQSVQTPELRLPLGQIVANEAQQLGAVARLVGRQPIGRAFPAVLPID